MDLPPPIQFFLYGFPEFDNPFSAMWYLIIHGGWFFILLFMLIGLWRLWVFEVGEQYENDKFKFVLLAINVPKRTEQSTKAVENIFASLMGLHISVNMWEKYWEGRRQENFACEIASHGGFIQFYMWVPVRVRDVFESAIFAQYPDAEVREAQDYAKPYPNRFPSDEWDCWGTELVVKKSECIPIKTYPMFEDKLTGTFKDPLAQMFEFMGTIQPGEELWVQYPIRPIEQDWQERCQNEALKMIGVDLKKEKGQKEGNTILAFFHLLGDMVSYVLHSAVAGKAPGERARGVKEPQKPRSGILYLSPGETERVKAVEAKTAKLGYRSKIRILYIARKELFIKNRKRAITGIMGVFRQFNAHDLNTFGLGKHTFVRAYYYFVQYRLNRRKRILMRAYKARSNTRGDKNSVLNVEELATLWHFPSLEISAPLLRKAEVKRGEPPSGLPMPGFESHETLVRPPSASGEQKEAPENLPFV